MKLAFLPLFVGISAVVVATGCSGDDGAQGSQGLQGPVGTAGPAGAAGEAGAAGAAGATGASESDAYHLVVHGDKDAATNGAALRAAVTAIADASATRPYTIELNAGIFDVGTASLVMKPFVSIHGDGRSSTTIKGIHQGVLTSDGAVVNLANATTLSDLTVENGPCTGGSQCNALYLPASAAARLARAGVSNNGGAAQLAVAAVTAGSLDVFDVELNSFGTHESYGLVTEAGFTQVASSRVTAVTYALFGLAGVNTALAVLDSFVGANNAYGGSTDTRFVGSVVSGLVVPGATPPSCAFCVTGDYKTARTATCQ